MKIDWLVEREPSVSARPQRPTLSVNALLLCAPSTRVSLLSQFRMKPRFIFTLTSFLNVVRSMLINIETQRLDKKVTLKLNEMNIPTQNGFDVYVQKFILTSIFRTG